MNKNLLNLLFPLLLIVAGLLSPSNGVDDKVEKDPMTMIGETMIIIGVALVVYLLAKQLSKRFRGEQSFYPKQNNNG